MTRFKELLNDRLDLILVDTDPKTPRRLVYRPSKDEYYIEDMLTKAKYKPNPNLEPYPHKTIAPSRFNSMTHHMLNDYHATHEHLLSHSWLYILDMNIIEWQIESVVDDMERATATPDTKTQVLSGEVFNEYENIQLPLDSQGYVKPYDVVAETPNKAARRVMGQLFMDDVMQNKLGTKWPSGEITVSLPSLWKLPEEFYKLIRVLMYRFGEENTVRLMRDMKQWPSFDTADSIIRMLVLKTDTYHPTENDNIFNIEYALKHSDMRFDFDKWHDYLLIESERQHMPIFVKNGLQRHMFISMWLTVLDMQIELHGHMTDKYPKDLKKMYADLTKQCDSSKLHEQTERWNEADVNARLKGYETTGDSWTAITPHSPQDMADEAAYQRNCLATYIDKVIDGKSSIVFIRHASKPKTPWITVEMNGPNIVEQAYLRFNEDLDDEAHQALKEYMTKLKK